MHILEASPPRNADIHLTSLRDLERHFHNESKHAGYERLLIEFGIDVGKFSALVQSPRVILAEQPGCWYYGYDLMRGRLLKLLKEANICHESSGALSLATDGFSCRGFKKYVVQLQFHPRLMPVQWIGAAHFRRHRNRVYSALPIDGSAHERIATIFDICLSMISSARISTSAFVDEVTGIFAAGVRPGARPILPSRGDKKSLRELGENFRKYDLGSARQPLARARQELREGLSWVNYWDRVNELFLGTPVNSLAPLFNRFLLTVADPVRMARNLIKLTRHPVGEPVPLLGVIVANEKYRMIFFDPDTKAFFYFHRPGQKRTMTWSRILQQARENRTGGPSAILEYLLMAASGIYMIVDPDDGYTRFERQAQEIHRHYTGVGFPFVAFPWHQGEPFMDYMKIFSDDFMSYSRTALERFFA